MPSDVTSIEVENERTFGGRGIEVERTIPLVDLGLDSATRDESQIDNAIWSAATDVGFFQVSGHGINQVLIDEAFAMSESFFGLKESTKSQRLMPKGSNSGWEFRGQRRPSTGTLDEKESYQITRARMEPFDLWPTNEDLAGFRKTMLDFEEANWKLAMTILATFARKLGFTNGFFEQAHDPSSPEYQSTLRLLHYLPMNPTDIMPGAWRAGAHTDYDCLTLLHQRPGQRGLQVSPGAEATQTAGRELEWTSVEPMANTITCNIGDMLTRWSDDQLHSTLHRVAMPEGMAATKSRYSIAFFAQANGDAIIQGPGKTYRPISASEFRQQRIAANFAATDAGS